MGKFDTEKEPPIRNRIGEVQPFKVSRKKINPYTNKEESYIQYEQEEADFITGKVDKIMPRKQNFSSDITSLYAKNGFMGMIDKKTKITVGEGGKKEHVTRKKKNNIFDVSGF